MQYTIRTEKAYAVIDEHASEIHSFRDSKNENEYMWQGNPAFWSGRNPTLFPMVGSTWDKTLHINGKEYHTCNHGFTRHSDFTCVEHDETHVIMELTDNEETLKEYPFHFRMHIRYQLKDDTLGVTYYIVNENDTVMPFNFGLHPAFNCPVCGGKFEDYHIELNQPESFCLNETEEKDCAEIPLDREALKKTIVITAPKSNQASLTNGKHGVTVTFNNYEWLAFWSPKAPFVCIEPWHSHGDEGIEVKVPFEKREGTILLKAHELFTTSYSIRIW